MMYVKVGFRIDQSKFMVKHFVNVCMQDLMLSQCNNCTLNYTPPLLC